ncbi:MAG TPA: ATP-dependent DNA helicase, partial [Terriglobales bacterium]
EMQDRLEKVIGKEAAQKIHACTFHSYCNQVLRRYTRDTFKLLSTEDLWVYFRKNIDKLGLKYFAKASDPGTFLRSLNQFFERCNDELMNASDYADYVARLESDVSLELPRVGFSSKDVPTRDEVLGRCKEIARVFAKVEEMLAAENIGSFGSLIVRTAKLFREKPDVLAKEQAKARFILVDEFQDTNHGQLELLRFLGGEEQNVFIVGDPDQAIYRFRGASAGAFDDFRRVFKRAVAVTLAENQRSTQNVLDCAWQMIRSNPENVSLEDDFARTPLKSGRAKRQPDLANHRVSLVLHDGTDQEAHEVARSIAETVERTGAAYKDFAVIYRGHSSATALVQALHDRTIPFSVAGTNLLETDTGRDLMASLYCMVSLEDNVSLFRVAMMKRSGLDPKAVQQALKSGKRRVSKVAEVLGSMESGRQLLDCLHAYREQVNADATAQLAVERAIQVFGLQGTAEAKYLLRAVEEWMTKPCIGARAGADALPHFLEYLELWAKAGGVLKAEERDILGARITPVQQPNAVQLMTVHAAKGLEFKHTYVVRVSKSSFPSTYKEWLFDFPQQLRKSSKETISEKELHQQEERRLFYVAITRAKDELTILGKASGTKNRLSPLAYMRELEECGALARAVVRRDAHAYVANTITAGASEVWYDLPADFGTNTLVLSASQIETYESCPKQFYFQYVWGLPSDMSVISQYGSAVHVVLRSLFDGVMKGKVIGLLEVLFAFEAEFSKYESTTEEKHQFDLLMEQGRRHLTAFYRTNILEAAALPKVKAVEVPFELQIDDVLVKGRMDRVDESGSGLVVIDYKTGKPKTEEVAKKSLQLSVYALAAESMWKKRVIEAAFYSLENNTPVWAEQSEEALSKVRERILAVAQSIRNGEFDPKPSEFKGCGWCGYRSLCPATAQKYFGPESQASIAPEL